MTKPVFVYVTYIATTPEKLWNALTDGEFTEKYFFGSRVESEWKEGSDVTYSRNGEVTDYGKILKCEPHKLLSFTWTYKGDDTPRQSPTIATFELHPLNTTVKLTLTHENLLESDIVEDNHTFEGFNNGWPAVISNLKSFLETGQTLSAVSI
ncbi:SRPBCC family protein [Fictibacillus sp. KIGAM418]|uniref:SRPBCC family protein n=1 Tax=Fictibacillus marinisediminis TaxID=2878389 RepID=A0A9X1X7L3_9BACL|nr:SRPBCC family protein [Fictibacillus marinisediminis]MCK6255542.1 SRPBCC family protein [Fictibacillus marinisediminis]